MKWHGWSMNFVAWTIRIWCGKQGIRNEIRNIFNLMFHWKKSGPPILKKKLCCLNFDGYCDREYIREYPIECGFAWGVGLHIQNELKRNMVGSSCIATPHHRRHSPSANAINYLSNVSCDAVTFAKWFDFVNKSLIIWLSILYYWESLQNCISRSGKSIMLIEFDKKASVCC